jgi:hypothetical protein
MAQADLKAAGRLKVAPAALGSCQPGLGGQINQSTGKEVLAEMLTTGRSRRILWQPALVQVSTSPHLPFGAETLAETRRGGQLPGWQDRRLNFIFGLVMKKPPAGPIRKWYGPNSNGNWRHKARFTCDNFHIDRLGKV